VTVTCACGCGRETDHPLYGKYYSFACKKRHEAPPAKEKRRKLEPSERSKTSGSRARHIRIKGMVKDFSPADWKRALDHFENKCAYCGESAKRLEQEHFVSVNSGGTYTGKNIIPACPKCNGNKRDKDPFEWLVVRDYGLVAYARITQYLDGMERQ